MSRVLILLAAAVGCLFGQLDRGSITGLVTDPTGAVVADAKVTATHVETNFASTTVTTETGNYTLPALLIGN